MFCKEADDFFFLTTNRNTIMICDQLHADLSYSRWWQLKYFYMFSPTWRNDPIWQAYFSNGLVQPPNQKTNPTLRNWLVGTIFHHWHDKLCTWSISAEVMLRTRQKAVATHVDKMRQFFEEAEGYLVLQIQKTIWNSYEFILLMDKILHHLGWLKPYK